MDPRAGELTALGIVEVPEDVPCPTAPPAPARPAGSSRRCSTTRRRARGSGRWSGSAAARPRGSWRPPRELDADLLIFGWGGKRRPVERGAGSDAGLLAHIDDVVREAPCDIAVVKQRGLGEVRRILVPVRGGPHAELALRVRRRARAPPRRPDRGPPRDPAGRHQRRPCPGGARPRHVRPAARPRRTPTALVREAPNVRNAILREAETADLVIMGAVRRSPRARRRTRTSSGPCRRRSRARAKPPVIVVKTRSAIGRATFERAGRRGPRRWRPPIAPPRRRGRSRRAWSAGSASPTSTTREFRDLRRLVDAQGAAGTDGQPGPADAQRGGDDRRRSCPRPGAS